MPIYALGDKAPILPAPDRYWIAPGAHVIGHVRLAEDVGIWFGAVLRGDTELISVGAGSNIQEGTTVHTDLGFPATIGAGCTIGHNAIIHGAEIGDNCLIGMDATVLNGVRIGRNSLVGANALLTEGKVFPEGSLIVGSPARVVRSLDEGAIARLRLSAAHYAENWKRFRRDIREIPG